MWTHGRINFLMHYITALLQGCLSCSYFFSQNSADRATLPDHVEGSVPESSLSNQSSDSPDINSSRLMLSISTIASAIADASISTDPSQLAAMIMELSKRSRGRSQSEAVAASGNTVTFTEEPLSAEHVRLWILCTRSLCHVKYYVTVSY